MRRLDVEEVIGTVPVPDVSDGTYLLEILFKVGPVRNEGPILEQDLEAWERRRGIELAPWQADTLIDLSKAYLAEMHSARERDAIPAWPPAQSMWRYVQGHKAEAALKAALKEPVEPTKGRNGTGKRHRNPPAG